ncbi:hypothetical protein CPB84DRAFT_1525590 [Gymnopilus junonius]|uniref:Uncharacterized protein n=1 Tax=Gymnopilus junonius TaxID=109634 RepID=A0A9P5NIK4_GYMJU|nr:hypothetical protein CPB84DRAFT_1525590 [Gymnopilus junonius]
MELSPTPTHLRIQCQASPFSILTLLSKLLFLCLLLELTYCCQFYRPAPQMPQPMHEEAQPPIVLPLPPLHEVIPSSSVHRVPSHTSSYSAGNGGVNLETDERLPLLARPVTPNKHHKHNPYTTQAPAGKDYSSISPLLASGSASGWNPNSHSSSHHSHHHSTQQQLRLHDLGWLEYHLPDGTVYYVTLHAR